jgi:hypothetical protein
VFYGSLSIVSFSWSNDFCRTKPYCCLIATKIKVINPVFAGEEWKMKARGKEGEKKSEEWKDRMTGSATLSRHSPGTLAA